MVHGETLIYKVSGSGASGYTRGPIANLLGLATSTPAEDALGVQVIAHPHVAFRQQRTPSDRRRNCLLGKYFYSVP
jgi:hypothetical protein